MASSRNVSIAPSSSKGITNSKNRNALFCPTLFTREHSTQALFPISCEIHTRFSRKTCVRSSIKFCSVSVSSRSVIRTTESKKSCPPGAASRFLATTCFNPSFNLLHPPTAAIVSVPSFLNSFLDFCRFTLKMPCCLSLSSSQPHAFRI